MGLPGDRCHISTASAQTQTDDSINRLDRAWPCHPREAAQALPVFVDARHKAGQDDLGCG